MKKSFLLSLLLMAVAVGKGAEVYSLADLDVSQAYLIRTASGYLYANGSSTYVQSSANSSDLNCLWGTYETQYGERVIYNVGMGSFLTGNGTTCPLRADAMFLDMLPARKRGTWHMMCGDYVLGLSSASTGIQFIEDLTAFAFEPTGKTIPVKTMGAAQAKALMAHAKAHPRQMLSAQGSLITSLTTLKDGMNVLLQKVNNSGQFVYESQGSRQLLLGNLQYNTYASLDHVLTLHKADDGWQLEMPASGRYVADIVQSVGIYTGDDPLTFTFAAHASTANAFTLLAQGTGQYFDGTGTTCVGWWDGSGANTAYKFYVAEVADDTAHFPVVYDCYHRGKHLGVQLVYDSSNRPTPPTFDGLTVESRTPWTATFTAATIVTVEYVAATDAAIGDVNNDKQITIADVTALVNIILGRATDTYNSADVNQDGVISIAYVTALVNKILKK